MKLLVKKERKKHVEELDREVIVQKPEKHLIKDTTKDFHTQFGVIKKEFFSSEDGAKTKTGNQEYKLLSPSFIDLYMNIERLAQIIPLKDIGPIITFTGMNKKSKVLDAGSGSGGLSLFLASIATCAGIYALEFCRAREVPTEGMRLTMTCEMDEKNQVCERVSIDLKVPEGFPEKYKKAVVRVMDLCGVKKHIFKPPEFVITAS